MEKTIHRPNRWPLIASILASSMAFIDGSALNVALAALQKDLHASGTELLWIVNGYNLPVSALILLGGSLGDRFGVKNVFSLGIILFLAASAVCGLAPTPLTLVIARAIQGLGGALLIPSSLSYLTLSTAEGERGKIIGTWSAFSTLTTILGPILGGILAGVGLWRGVFYLNLPLGLFALWVLKYKDLETQPAAAGPSIDYGGAFFITAALAFLSGGLLAGNNSAGSSHTGFSFSSMQFGIVGVALVFFVAFILYEKRHSHPMLPLTVFRSRTFTCVNIMTLLLYSTLYGALLFVPMNLIQIQNYPDSLAGAAGLPFALMVILLSPVAGKLLDKHGPHLLLTFGPLLVGCGFVVMSFIGITTHLQQYWVTFLPAYLLLGLGMGLTIAPLTTTVMSALPKGQTGIASGVNNAAARVAGVLAVAILGLIFVGLFHRGMNERLKTNHLTPTQLSAMEKEINNLAAAKVSADFTVTQSDDIHHEIQLSFVESFKWVSLIAAFLCLLSGLFAFVTLKPKKLV